ncbi:MAG: hypothetical protein ACPGWR_11810, partial [Ardenticatenaceae bacterium]
SSLFYQSMNKLAAARILPVDEQASSLFYQSMNKLAAYSTSGGQARCAIMRPVTKKLVHYGSLAVPAAARVLPFAPQEQASSVFYLIALGCCSVS